MVRTPLRCSSAALACAIGAAFLGASSASHGGSLGAPMGLPTTSFATFDPSPSVWPLTSVIPADRPHPAVVRVIVPEGEATSYGSGTLVDVREQFGLVITNWHVVRDGQGDVEVLFPNGFRSKARPLKVDSDWDLAALVIWRPEVEPVRIAARAPQSGDRLTICGYGQGQYRAATGRCTKYYAPKQELPMQMVELDVEARQGDSGGPIFNDRGELAGVLFGAGSGTTLGSFGGRVQSFLASLAPDIGREQQDGVDASRTMVAEAKPPAPAEQMTESAPLVTATLAAAEEPVTSAPSAATPWDALPQPSTAIGVAEAAWQAPLAGIPLDGSEHQHIDWVDHGKTALAVLGLLAIVRQVIRAAG